MKEKGIKENPLRSSGDWSDIINKIFIIVKPYLEKNDLLSPPGSHQALQGLTNSNESTISSKELTSADKSTKEKGSHDSEKKDDINSKNGKKEYRSIHAANVKGSPIKGTHDNNSDHFPYLLKISVPFCILFSLIGNQGFLIK